MAKGREYDNGTKAAVMAALLAGQSISQVAKQYDLPTGTIKSWKARLQPVELEKKEELGVLIGSCLVKMLNTLAVQVEFFAKEEWLKKQSGGDAAVLHGVLWDKAIRLLEAGERARREAASDADSA